ncbi:hypothetical protein OSB04_016772 [Centaurea solstitialis]|uniref:CCHC-type domain-containing protein n=1 Tax=Centaurea solstitialis TaxID=347529 RepID=A0AA38W8U0_9ASTR|nr:hypothetical protein OSB04_016772 [Centaurea solstitialis]
MASTVTSTNNLSLRSILEKDKLTGSNFLDWERNLMIVLRHERKWYVLEEPLGEAPPANAPAAARNAHKKHSDDLLDVACLMLATMSPDLQAGLINTNAYDMIRQLRDMFQTQARTERYDATKAFNECKMVKGTSVSDHVMKMKRHLDHLERLGHPVPLQLATDTILNSLSEDYRPFVVNYNMNNMEKTIAELHSMLKTAELNMGNKNKTKDVLIVKDGGVKKKNGHASTSKGKGPVQAIQSAPKKGKGKGKGKKVKPNKARTENRCFICNEIGHWRQNCPKRHEAGRNHSSTQQLRRVAVYIFRNWKLVQTVTPCGSALAGCYKPGPQVQEGNPVNGILRNPPPLPNNNRQIEDAEQHIFRLANSKDNSMMDYAIPIVHQLQTGIRDPTSNIPHFELKTSRNEIYTFRQEDDEAVPTAWERFKELLRKCPHHGIPYCIQLETFYNGLNYSARQMLDATAGGAFTASSYNEGYNILEKISNNNGHWADSRSKPLQLAGAKDDGTYSTLASQLRDMAVVLKNLTTNKQVVSSINTPEPSELPIQCVYCSENHLFDNCPGNPEKGQLAQLVTDSWGLLTRSGRVWVLVPCEARQTLLDEAHKSKFSIHLGSTKMYRNKNQVFVAGNETRCSSLRGEVPDLSERAWMRFGIVDRLTKSAHFIAINESSSSEKLVDIYVKEVVARHGDFYCWGEVGQRELGSTEIMQKTTESIEMVRERLRTTKSRQKSYADKRRSDLEFNVGDDVLLKVSPWKGVIRFRKRGKLGPRYIGPFKVIARVGKVAYRLELPPELSQIHKTFQVSQLRKCLADESAHIPINDIQVDERLNYVESQIAVLERKTKTLWNKEIGLVKV